MRLLHRSGPSDPWHPPGRWALLAPPAPPAPLDLLRLLPDPPAPPDLPDPLLPPGRLDLLDLPVPSLQWHPRGLSDLLHPSDPPDPPDLQRLLLAQPAPPDLPAPPGQRVLVSLLGRQDPSALPDLWLQ